MSVKSIDFSTKVSEVMKSPVRSIGADWSLGKVIKFFLENKFSGAPVVDGNGSDLGVVSFKDVAQFTEQLVGEVVDQVSQIRAIDIMTKDVITLNEDATISDALALMIDKHIHRVFVRDQSGKISGIVSTMDIILWLRSISGS